MYIDIDGVRIYAYTGSRPRVPGQPGAVFVHGAGFDHTVWTMHARYFAYHGYNAYAIDLPGHGRSAGAPLASIAEAGAWLSRFCAATGDGPVLLAGHSMGSLVSLECAAQAPQAVAALALVGTALPMQVADALQRAADANEHDAIDMITVWGHSLPAQLGGGPHTPGVWLTASSNRLLERAAPGVLGADLRACNNYQDGVASAARVQAPTLLILGQLDIMTPPRAARELHAALPHAERLELASAGHNLMGEQPDGVLDALIGLAARMPARAA